MHSGRADFTVVRLGIYTDLVYRREGDVLSADRPFVFFLAALVERVEEVVLFGRLHPRPGRDRHVLPAALRFVPLPHYPTVSSLGALLPAVRRTQRAFAEEAQALDAVWIFGPHPISLALVRTARRYGVPIFLGVRQDFPRYITERASRRRRVWAVPAAHAFEQSFRLLARRFPTVVVGEELARRYRRARGALHVTGISLVPTSAIIAAEEALAKAWDGDLTVLSVGRIDREKNPLLLVDIMARLRGAYPGWRLVVVGEGPLEQAVAARARELGVAESVELAGFVPFGPELMQMYRNAHVFLHVSLTEGVPQVLFEAHASGVPVVATDVGGVRSALGNGIRGLLVPPADAEAAAVACEHLRRDPALRRRLVGAGLQFAEHESIDAQLDRLVAFFEARLEGPLRTTR